MVKLIYPAVKRDSSFVEKLHGIDVPDPYRWLENENDEQVHKFAQQQQDLTMSYIKDLPNRDKIKEKLSSLVNYPKYGCPSKHGDNYYMSKNSGLQNQSVIYMFKDLEAEHEVFLDPNTFAEDGTTSCSSKKFSKDGKWCAYQKSVSGSDWKTIHVRNVETKQDLPDELTDVKFSDISWTLDNQGFFYSKYPKAIDDLKSTRTDENHQLFYHYLRTDQKDDVLVYSQGENPKRMFSGDVSDCGNYLFLSATDKCNENALYYANLDQNQSIKSRLKFYPIADKFDDSSYSYITNTGSVVYLLTNNNAPNSKVIKLDLANKPTDSSTWIDVVPEDKNAVLEDATCVDNDKLALVYMRDVVNQIEVRELDGKFIKKLDIPIGSVSFTGRKDSSEIFIYMTSFLSPGSIYHYDFKNGDFKPKLFMQINFENFDPNDYCTEQVFYESKDGQVKIPMFITHKKGIKLDSSNPALLYGYGGFNISLTPFFSALRLFFMKYFNGVYAIANIRGGGEYGQNWYDQGRLLNKQNCMDDFQQAAEYLIANGYTNKGKLTIEGGSNGGLLVATCANQRPDLFGACICHVGVLDLTRFHKFTIGSAWISDYGDNSIEGEEGLKNLKNQLKLSPYHNVPNDCTKYPATLILTSDHDNRVSPLHSFKFAAELQHKLGDKVDDPLLLRVDMKAGHGGGKPISKVIDEFTDVYSFIQKSLGLKFNEN